MLLQSNRLNRPALFFVTPPDTPDDHLVNLVALALEGGVTHVLLRRPESTARQLYDLALWLTPPVHAADAALVIAERLDVALAIEGAGVQLSARSLPLHIAKQIAPGRPMGASVHAAPEPTALRPADWLIAGNIYDTATHPKRPGKGAGLVREIADTTSTPVIAIGGITPARVPEVMLAGAAGIAVIRAISDAPSPTQAARTLRDALDNATGDFS